MFHRLCYKEGAPRQLDALLTGVLHLAKYFLPSLKGRQELAEVNVNPLHLQ
jgi:hypothetical protein